MQKDSSMNREILLLYWGNSRRSILWYTHRYIHEYIKCTLISFDSRIVKTTRYKTTLHFLVSILSIWYYFYRRLCQSVQEDFRVEETSSNEFGTKRDGISRWIYPRESMPFVLHYSVQSNAVAGIRVTC